MSLINQVLDELEKRGARVSVADVAAVPQRKRFRWQLYVLVAGVLLFVGGGVWYAGHEAAPVVEPAVAARAPYELTPGIAASSAPASSVAQVMAKEPDAGIPPLSLKIAWSVSPASPVTQSSVTASSAREPRQRDTAVHSGAGMKRPIKVISPQQQAEGEFARAGQAEQEGRLDDALAAYRNALQLNPRHQAARRAWAGLLISLRRNEEAEQILKAGLEQDPHDAAFAMLLARLQVERNAQSEALATLQKNLPDAANSPDYQAFYAALLQRENRHQEAIDYFQKALVFAPDNGIWLMGLGISLQAEKRIAEARIAYQRALASNMLNAELQDYVQQKLKTLE